MTDEHPPGRPDDPSELADRGRDVGHVVEHVPRAGPVEAAGAERQPLGVAPQAVPVRARLGQHRLRLVEPDQPTAVPAASQVAQEVARPAADVEQRLRPLDLQRRHRLGVEVDLALRVEPVGLDPYLERVGPLVLAPHALARAHVSSVISRCTRVVTRGPSAVMTTLTSERTPKSGR